MRNIEKQIKVMEWYRSDLKKMAQKRADKNTNGNNNNTKDKKKECSK